MDIEKLLDKFFEGDITKMSNEIIEFFEKEIPIEIKEKYDLGELIVEFIGHHETANKYEKIEKLCNTIKKNHKTLYEEDGDYFNESLVKYYIFKENSEKLTEQIEDYLNRNYNYDILLSSFDQLLLNNYSKLLDHIIESEFENVKNNKSLITGAEFKLAVNKYYLELEKLIETEGDKEKIDSSRFIEVARKYNFDIKEDELKLEFLKNGWSLEKMRTESKALVDQFPKNKERLNYTLKRFFMKWMQNRKVSFAVSSHLWEQFWLYLDNRKTKNIESYFKIEKNSFSSYLSKKQGLLSDNRRYIILYLWGSEYILDFLKTIEILNDNNNYETQQIIINELKNEFKKSYKHYLWEMNYIHKWEPSKNENHEIWKKEAKEFIDSYDLEINDKQLSELKFDQLFGDSFLPNEEIIEPKREKYVEVRTEKKIGRNEKVSVKYLDGSVKKNIKYKKVLNDLENGICELIK